jgi:hypothetical protein
MFAEQLRRAVEASPRVELAKVAGILWRAFAAGQVTEAEASALSEAIEARKALPAAQKPIQRRCGSRPKTPESLTRRRRWVASGWLPPQLATAFTAAETAVLSVIAAEAQRHGACTLTVAHVAALAGVSETTVRNAVREARRRSFLHVEERRVAAWRNLSNRITIVSREWQSWLRLRGRGGGCSFAKPTKYQENKTGVAVQRNGVFLGDKERDGRTAPQLHEAAVLTETARPGSGFQRRAESLQPQVGV